jgi:NADH dehydrogenase (ubiquinone) 1 alpha subcomplex subunit 9
LNITRNGKTLIAAGSGGRSSRTGYTATVFGANGFLGTHLVAKLARHGTITVVPFREEMSKRHLKVTGDLGVVNFIEFDLRNLKSIEEAVRHSDIVFNLIGKNSPTKNFTFDDVHVEGARRIANAVKKYNVSRFVHVSSYNADPNSKSGFYASKGVGEEVVREIIPDTTIVRPGPMFGNGDRLLNNIASTGFHMMPNEGRELLRPTYVIDVASALEAIGYEDWTAGKLFELNGPREYTKKQLFEAVKEATKLDILEVTLPRRIHDLIAEATQLLYWETTSPDEIARAFIDQVVTPGALGFHDLGITPQKLEDRIIHLLRHHRSNVYLHDSYETDQKRKKERDISNIVD